MRANGRLRSRSPLLRRAMHVAWPLAACTCALAQVAPDIGPGGGSAPRQSLRVEAGVTLTSTIADTSSAGGITWVTSVAPGIKLVGQRGRLRGHFEYQLQGLALGVNSSTDNDLRHQLDTAFTAELIEDHLFVDAAATIAREPISPFGRQSADPLLPNSNLAEQRKYSIAPVLRGSLFGRVDYLARVAISGTRNDASPSLNSNTVSALARLSGGTLVQGLSWAVEATKNQYDFGVTRDTFIDRVGGQVNYAITPSLQVSLLGGRETNDLRTAAPQDYNNSGWAIDWRPSVRTRLFARQEKRFFGNAHSIVAEHRTARTTFSFTDRRDISTPNEQRTLAAIGTIYDEIFRQFETRFPDPVVRNLAVLAYLNGLGVDPRTPIYAGFLTASITLSRDQALSFSWTRLRDTVTLSWYQSWVRRADTLALGDPDDFSDSALVHQRGLNAAVTHRLSPQSSVTLAASISRARGDLAAQSNDLRSLSVNYSLSLSPKSTFSGGLRHSRFGSATQPYNETALTASIGTRF